MPSLKDLEEDGAGGRESPAGAKETGPGIKGVCSRVATMGRGKGRDRWEEWQRVQEFKATT